MAYVYILYSNKINTFYIGSCKELEKRLSEHTSNKYQGFTARVQDWKLHLSINNLEYQQARKVKPTATISRNFQRL